jgi:hypothetical protein
LSGGGIKIVPKSWAINTKIHSTEELAGGKSKKQHLQFNSAHSGTATLIIVGVRMTKVTNAIYRTGPGIKSEVIRIGKESGRRGGYA